MGNSSAKVCSECKANRKAKAASHDSSGFLSQTQRAQLESEADHYAEHFMRGHWSNPVQSSISEISIHSKKPGSALPIMRKAAPEEETEQLTNDNKGQGDITETAESNVGEPVSVIEDDSNEAAPVLTKSRPNATINSPQSPPGLSGGHALTPSDRAQMEAFFGRDFSGVRIHSDRESHQYTESIGALAATKSNHVFFSSSANPGSDKRLLAHELTHVVQQRQAPLLGGENDSMPANALASANASPVQTKQAPAISNTPIGWQLYQSTICQGKVNEHASTQPRDFPATYISTINVSLTNQRVTLDWTGPSVAEAQRIVRNVTGDGIINCSTGAGVRGQTSCNNRAHSNRSSSCCTPIGTFTLGSQSCVTPRLRLQNFSGFGRSGVGFHYYSSVPRHPASHGCVRLHRGASKIIFDNARTGHTSVVVSGSFSGSHSRYRSCS